MNKEISVYDNSISARAYLSYIAEQAGGFACIGRDGKLYIKTIGETEVIIPLKLFKTFKWGEKFKLTRVRYEDGVQMYEKGDTTGNTVYISQDNMYIVDQEQIDNIYNAVKDLEVYSFEGEAIIDPAIDLGDILVIDGKKVIYQGSRQYSGRWIASISSKIQGKSKEETTVKKPSQKAINRRIESKINQAEGKITQLVQETTEQSQKITEVEQTVDGISQKVENIQEFTKEKTQTENIFLDDVAEGEGYILKFIVYGNTENFTAKDITIAVSKASRGYGDDVVLLTEDGQELLTEDGQTFIIGQGAYYIKSLNITLDDYLRNITKDGKEYFDTLEIAQDGTIKVVRRIGVNEQGGLFLLEKEIETTLEEKIVLPSLSTKTYYFIQEISGLNYYAQYIIENDYSKTFLPRLELGTKIEQNAEAVKVAWNQISEFIQMMILNNNASLAVLDKDKKVLMSLDKTGQHFYSKNNETVFGEMGVQEVDKKQFIAFSVEGEYGSKISNGMAWGIKTKDGKFHPIMYIKDFEMASKESEVGHGELTLSACNILLDGNDNGIISGNIFIHGNIRDGISFDNIEDDSFTNFSNLMKIFPKISTSNGEIIILDKINFFANQAGSNSLRIGDLNNYCLLTDGGDIHCTKSLSINNGDTFYADEANVWLGSNEHPKDIIMHASVTATLYGNLDVQGSIYADNLTSDRRIKKNIKDSTVKAIDIIKKIKHKQFDKINDNKHYDIGFVAQEMEEIDPNFVLLKPKTDKTEETYYINELPIIATLSKAIQEQQEQIEKMQKEINELKGDE